MGGVAALARAAGHEVTGCDRNVYPPMSTQLKDWVSIFMKVSMRSSLTSIPTVSSSAMS